MSGLSHILLAALGVILLVQAVSGAYSLVDVIGTGGSDPGYFNGARGVVVDGDGLVYVADTDNNRIQVFSPDGRLVRSWGSQGTGPTQFVQPIPIAIGPDNNLYIGDRGNHRVVVYTKTGSLVREMGTAGMDPWGIAVAPDGDVFVSSGNQNVVHLFGPDGTLLDSFGGPGREEGKLSEPTGCVFGSDGLLYILEIGTQRVQRMDQYGVFHGTFISTHLWKPIGCAFDAAGNFYVADEGTFIARFGPDGTFIEDWNGRCEARKSAGKPNGISVDGAGRVYVTDVTSNWVAIWKRSDLAAPAPTQTPAGAAYSHVRTIDRASSGWFFDEPSDVAVGATGTIFIANTGYGEIVALSSAGTYQRSWLGDEIDDPYEIAVDSVGRVYALGTSPGPYDRIERYEQDGTDLGGWPTEYSPSGFTVDAAGQVWVAEPYDHRVSVYASSGGLLRRIQQPGSPDALVWNPTAVAVEPGGGIIVVLDSGDLANTGGGPTPFHRVKRFSSMGAPSTAWSGNGTGSGLGFRAQDAACDARGRIYVADTGNDRVQVFSAQGTLLAQWGTTGSGTGQFHEPRGIGVDASGRVYVADTGNDRVQVFAPPEVVVFTLPGGTGLPTSTAGNGVYDDVNGNGRMDFADVVLYFNQMTWISANEPMTAFDYNGNGRIDFADVVWLFDHL